MVQGLLPLALLSSLTPAATASPTLLRHRIPLDRVSIVADPGQPTYVRHGLDDLRAYLRELGGTVRRAQSLDRADGTVILIGPQITRRVLGAAAPTGLGDEGYCLRSLIRDGQVLVLVTGETPRGTRFGITALMGLLRKAGGSPYLDGPLAITSRPAFVVRGMHLNGWAFGSPYSFRAWTEAEWHQYLDLLSCQGANLIFLWPFMEIIPVPLSPEDEAYLREFRRVVAYAQQECGMQVWMMQSGNRVARDDGGVRDPRRRPYWRPSQVDMNPADPAQFQAIMASREALYRIVNNVDAVCTIDSDPGSFPDSSIADYVRILQGCRSLLDRHNVHGRQTQLINWMWAGWGRRPAEAFGAAFQAETVRALKRDMPEPWGLVAGGATNLDVCRDEGVLDRTVYLPYGTIEGEPSYPGTNLSFGAIRDLRRLGTYPGLRGVLGNAQCPLLQLPNVYLYLSALWDPRCLDWSDDRVLSGLTSRLYPDHAKLTADCYAALGQTDWRRVSALADRLDSLTAREALGRPGLFGRQLFPDDRFVAHSLVMQLRLQAALERLYAEVTAETAPEQCAELIGDCLDAYLTWDHAHGWHDLWGRGSWPLGRFGGDPRFQSAVGALRQSLGTDEAVSAFCDDLTARLSATHDPACVTGDGTGPLRQAILAAVWIPPSLALEAEASASVTPDAGRYPPRQASDQNAATLYWPGALVTDNTEWLQLTWPHPVTVTRVVAHFLRHESMWARTIHLQQQEIADGRWTDLATCAPTDDGRHAVATFALAAPVALDRLRIVNLLDLFEVEVR